MGREKNAENIPFLRSTQPKSTERVPVVELSGSETDSRTPFLILPAKTEKACVKAKVPRLRRGILSGRSETATDRNRSLRG